MTTAYFLTGSFNDLDHDFELKVTVTESSTDGLPNTYHTVLTDTTDNSNKLWETSQPTFLKCMNAMDEFLTENFIILYSKILTSKTRDSIIDKELEGFILNHLDI